MYLPDSRDRPLRGHGRRGLAGILFAAGLAACGGASSEPASTLGQVGESCAPDGSCAAGLRCVQGRCAFQAAGDDAGLAWESCEPGAARGCYDGPAGTRDEGICRGGEQRCEGGQWAACVGQVLPMVESCDGLDNDCNGSVDPGCDDAPQPGQDAGTDPTPTPKPDAGVPADGAAPPDVAPASCQTATECDDGHPCTLDECKGGSCSHLPLTGLACNDGDACTHDDVCDGGGQCSGVTVTCDDDPGPCGAKRTCNGTSQCTTTFAGSTTNCFDGSSCTINDKCDGAGQCKGTLKTSWTRVVSINYTQANPDYQWATLQQKTWAVDRAVKRIRVSGASDDGGYCYAHWGTGHVAAYRHTGSVGYHNLSGKYYSKYGTGCGGDDPNPAPNVVCSYCPAPAFDDSGTVSLCQHASDAGGLVKGTHEAKVLLKPGDTVGVKARHVIGKNSDFIQCFVDVNCTP